MQPASPAPPPPPTQQPDESGSSKDAHCPGSHKRKRRLGNCFLQYSSSSSEDELNRGHEKSPPTSSNKSSPTSSPSKARGGGNNNATRNDAGKDQLVSSSLYALCDLINSKSGTDDARPSVMTESNSSDTRRKLGECHLEPLIATRELVRRYEVVAKSFNKSALEQQSDEAEAKDLSTSLSTSSSHISAFSGVAADNSRLGAETAAASTLNGADLFSAINELNRSSKLLATKSEVIVAAVEDITAQMTHLQCSFLHYLSAASAHQPGGSAEFPPPSQSAGFADRVPPASSPPSRIQKVDGSPSPISASTNSRSRGRPRLRHAGPSIRAQDRAAGYLSTRTAATHSHRRSVSSFGQQQSTLPVLSRLNNDQGSRGHIVPSQPNYRRRGGDAQPLEEVEPYALPPAMIMPPESSTANEPSPPRHPSPFIKVEDEIIFQRASNLALGLLEDQNDSQVLSESLLPNAPCVSTTQYKEEEEEKSDDSYHSSIEDAAAAERQLLLEMSTAH